MRDPRSSPAFQLSALPIAPEAPVATLDLDALRIGVYDLTPGSESRAHAHGDETWVLGAAGALELASARAAPAIGAGAVMRIPADLVHGERVHAGGSRCFLLRPGAALLERLLRASVEPRVVRDPELDELARRLMRLLPAPGAPDALAALQAEGLALTTLALAARLERASDSVRTPWLARVRAALDDDPRSSWTHARLAHLAGVTPEHLARRFRAAFGCTVAEHLRRRRLARARQLLVETRLGLTAIAAATGFADHSHFSRRFRAAFGTTPSAFRAAHARRRG